MNFSGAYTKKRVNPKTDSFRRVNGGARTHDNQNHNLALYQLNYAHHVQDCKGMNIFLQSKIFCKKKENFRLLGSFTIFVGWNLYQK